MANAFGRPVGRPARCCIEPLPDRQAVFLVEGIERLRWHFGPGYPRPFFYPLIGPSGRPLTRMGHPGAPDHDHHRSIWFAHHAVQGVDFWTEQTAARIRQKQWLAYQDGDEEALMAVRLGWYDGHDPKELLEQELVAAVRPGPEGETFVELQSTFRPTAQSLEFGKTNFGFLAVRVAKGLSVHFGGGKLTNSAGAEGEAALFARPALWVDYSGPAPKVGVEGITYFDHFANPGRPTCWHVREDGWMGAAVCLNGPLTVRRSQPMVLRYLLHAHGGGASAERADKIAADFGKRPLLVVRKSMARHQHFEIVREG